VLTAALERALEALAAYQMASPSGTIRGTVEHSWYTARVRLSTLLGGELFVRDRNVGFIGHCYTLSVGIGLQRDLHLPRQGSTFLLTQGRNRLRSVSDQRGPAPAISDRLLDSRQPSPTDVLMRLIGLPVVLAVILTLAPVVAEGQQQAEKVYRIGSLPLSS